MPCLQASLTPQPDQVRWAVLLLELQESLMRQRGEVAKERTDAVHLMTQAELDVKEMQDSMQNSRRTQVSGVCSVTALSLAA